MIYVKINDTRYPASIDGRMRDHEWDGRASKYITLSMSFDEASQLFTDDLNWSIIMTEEEDIYKVNNEGQNVFIETITSEEEYDNSEYSIMGNITAHRDGTITVQMGMPTAEELLNMLIGGIEQ